MVEVKGDRVYFAGRKDDVINVGGAKVSPLTVERVIRSIPNVAQVRVYPRRSSLAGELVAAEFTITPGAVVEEVCTAVRAAVRKELLPHEVPQFIQAVDEIPVNDAQKMVRR